MTAMNPGEPTAADRRRDIIEDALNGYLDVMEGNDIDTGDLADNIAIALEQAGEN